MNKTSFLAGLLLLLSSCLTAQTTAWPCDSSVTFADRNMVDYTIEIGMVRGQVLDPGGAAMPGGCVALFAADRSTLLHTVEADENGKFAMPDVKDGSYWLVVHDPQWILCPATAHVKVKRSRMRKKTVVVHMKPRGIDDCSYCEAK